MTKQSILWKALIFLSIVSVAFGSSVLDRLGSSIVNTAVTSVYDLRSPLTVVEYSVNFKVDEGKKAVNSYYFALPNAVAKDQLSIVKVSQKKDQLKVTLEESDEKFHYYNIHLESPVNPGEKSRILISIVLIEAIKPYPREIPQIGQQQYEFSSNALFYSLYPTETAKANVRVPPGKKPYYKESTVAVSAADGKVSYGPVSDLPPLHELPIYLQYYDKQPSLIVKEYQKSFEVSHWANTVSVKEDYEVLHQGARIEGFFSRIDHRLNAHKHDDTNVVKGFVAILPPKATNVFYKDVVGNVSTSHFRSEYSRSILELEPRYPLFGGWKYTWFHGYTVPASYFVKQETGSNTYVVSIRLTGSIEGLAARLSTLRVVLPEGAKYLKVDSPYELDSSETSVTYSYYDTIGRPTIILQKKNIVDFYKGDIKIYYEFENVRLLQKPLVVAAYIFGFFVVLMIYSRLDLSITVDPSKKLRNKLALYRHKVSKLASEEGNALVRLTSAFESFKTDRDLAAFEATKSSLASKFTSVETDLARIAKETNALDAKYASKVNKLIELFSTRLERVRAMHSKVVAFLVAEAKAGDSKGDVKKRMELTEEVEKFDAEFSSLSGDVKAVLKHVSE